MRQDDRVVVEVDDLGRRGDPLCDLVHVLRGGQPRADVEQLPGPGFPHQVAHDAAEHVPLGAHPHLNRGHRGDDPVAHRPVGGEVVLATQRVIVDVCDIRDCYDQVGREP